MKNRTERELIRVADFNFGADYLTRAKARQLGCALLTYAGVDSIVGTPHFDSIYREARAVLEALKGLVEPTTLWTIAENKAGTAEGRWIAKKLEAAKDAIRLAESVHHDYAPVGGVSEDREHGCSDYCLACNPPKS